MEVLKVEQKTYPNGDKYLQLYVGKTPIGHVSKVDGGYLTSGKRKPQESIKDCAKQLIDGHMNLCMKEHEKWRKMLRRVLDS